MIRPMRFSILSLSLVVALLSLGQRAVSAENTPLKVPARQWVTAGVDGKLNYETTPKGDRIIDRKSVV